MSLLLSRQAIKPGLSRNEFSEWFGEGFEKLNVITTYNLVYNAAISVEEGIGYAVTIDKIANTSSDSKLCFKPLEPRLESESNIVWKKHQVFSQGANLFFEEIRVKFSYDSCFALVLVASHLLVHMLSRIKIMKILYNTAKKY